jgi:hypothetical protein
MVSRFFRRGALAFLCIGFSALLFAQDPSRPARRGGPGGPGGRERALFREFDRDGDGRLSREERQAARARIRKEREEGGGPGFRPRRNRGPQNAEPPQPGPRVTPAEVRLYPRGGLYRPSVLRTLFLDFEDQDWEKELADFYRTDVEVPADLLVDGRMFEGVGARFRGASSFFTVGEGWKRSLNLALESAGDQKLHGQRTLELLNAHRDPTFARTFLYSRIARRYLPAPRANHVKVVINGESWGIYVNQEQFNRDFVKKRFGDRSGARFRVPANPGGGRGLAYLGDDPQAYQRSYKLLTKQAGEKPWSDLIRLCRTLEDTPPERLEEALHPLLNVDGALWFLAVDNVLINNDGYWIRASDFNLYQDPRGRFHIVPHDANETFDRPGGPGLARGTEIAGVGLDPLYGAEDGDKPLLRRLLGVPSLRSRYLAHVRTVAEEGLDWKKLGPPLEKLQALIAGEVKADTRKLESFEGFRRGFGEGSAEETSPGPRQVLSLRGFVEERRKYLLDQAEVKRAAPRIAKVTHQTLRDGRPVVGVPAEGESVRVTAQIGEGIQPEQVYLYYAIGKSGPFTRLEMAKDRESEYVAAIPPEAVRAGLRYYLEARSTSRGTTSFSPARTEAGALKVKVKD